MAQIWQFDSSLECHSNSLDWLDSSQVKFGTFESMTWLESSHDNFHWVKSWLESSQAKNFLSQNLTRVKSSSKKIWVQSCEINTLGGERERYLPEKFQSYNYSIKSSSIQYRLKRIKLYETVFSSTVYTGTQRVLLSFVYFVYGILYILCVICTV